MTFIQIAFFSLLFLSVFLPFCATLPGWYRAAYVAAAASLPICYYLSGSPVSFNVPLIFPVLTVAGGKLLRTRRTIGLWLLFSPHLITVIWLVIRIAIETNARGH